MLLGFRLHGRLVFRSRTGRLDRFAMVFVAMSGLSLLVQAIARPHLGGYLAGALATAMTVPISFLLNRSLVFGRGGPAPTGGRGGD